MTDTLDTLNDLLQLHCRSLAVYLADCLPWTAPNVAAKAAVLRDIAASQRDTADRIAELIIDLNGAPDLGDFPLHFTRFNDLSFDYLLGELTTRQRQIVRGTAECVQALREGPSAALAIAEEAHGAALGDLDRLVELSQPASATS